jgi:alpha-ketoglutarate-dependent taurine dioxygenase
MPSAALQTDEAVQVVPLAPFGLRIKAGQAGASIASLPLSSLREAILQHRLLVLRGFTPFAGKEAFAAHCATWGELLTWDFGTVFEVVEHDDPTNYLFTSGSVPYHWDGAFARQVPWLQIFQCLESPGPDQGGETLFCDTPRIWRSANPEQRAVWQKIAIDYFTEKVAHYGGSIRAPLVGVHPITGETTLRFAEPANASTVRLNTPELQVHGLPESEIRSFLDDLLQRIYAPANVHAHAWQAGDLVIADNHALLHGRTPYRSKLPRRLWRVHVL